jgi:hypothetical protein
VLQAADAIDADSFPGEIIGALNRLIGDQKERWLA